MLEHLGAPWIDCFDARLSGDAGDTLRSKVDLLAAVDDDLVTVRAKYVAWFDDDRPRLGVRAVLLRLWQQTHLGAADLSPAVQHPVVQAKLCSEVLLLEREVVRRDQLARVVTRALGDALI